jgi:hypothetical protein
MAGFKFSLKQVRGAIRTALPFISMAKGMIENLDEDEVGTDDKLARAIRDVEKQMRAFVETETETKLGLKSNSED